MDDFQLFDGSAFWWLKDDPAAYRISPVVFLDLLPPCACGTASDDALLRIIYWLLEGGFSGVRELKGKEPSTSTILAITYAGSAHNQPLWLSIDQDSIAGLAIMALLLELNSGTLWSERDLIKCTVKALEIHYTEAGRAQEFKAAAKRARVKLHARECLQ